MDDEHKSPRVRKTAANAKHWCFTVNFAGPDGVAERALRRESLDELLNTWIADGTITYCVYGLEVGASGTPHLQGYMELGSKKRVTWLRKNFDNRGHYEPRRGSPEQAASYCKEDGEFFEFGKISTERSSQGKRTDLVKAKEALDGGMNQKEFSNEHFAVFIKFAKGIAEWRAINEIPRVWITEVVIFWGATRTGKTTGVVKECGGYENLWFAMDNSLKWFDGYAGQDNVIFDDFDAMPPCGIAYMLKLCDSQPMSVQTKGSRVNWKPRRIYFTSNLPWTEWTGFGGLPDAQREAWEARITKVVHFDKINKT